LIHFYKRKVQKSPESMPSYIQKVLFSPPSTSPNKSEKISSKVKLFTAKEVEDEKLKVTLQFKDVIKNLTAAHETEKNEVVDQLRDLETKFVDIDTESLEAIGSYEKENKIMKREMKDLEDKTVGDELSIMNLKIENEQLKDEIARLKAADENFDLLSYTLYYFNDYLKGLKDSEKVMNLLNVFPVPAQEKLVENALIVNNYCGEFLANLHNVPKSIDSLLTSILPNQLVNPIDHMLENVPILTTMSGQSYKPSAEYSNIQGQTDRALAGQAAIAAQCGLVFRPWKP